MINRYLSYLDRILDFISKWTCSPYLTGYFKDICSYFFHKPEALQHLKKMNFRIDLDAKLLKKQGYVNTYSEDLYKEFLPYIKKIEDHKFESLGRSKPYFYNFLNDKLGSEYYQKFLNIGSNSLLRDDLESVFGKLCFIGGGIYRSPGNSVNDNFPKGSQLWHIDRYSLKTIKVFINLSEITEEMGPTRVIASNHSIKLLKNSFLRRVFRRNNLAKGVKGLYMDKKKFAYYAKEKNGSNIGVPGTTLIANTGLCIHQGSNNRSSKDRFILLFHYCAWDRFIENQQPDLLLGINTRFLK
ncbi:hypothetical protein [Prochlorococcus sp. MIT 1011]|uniref:hypothetical protein n=1 Tax=Prochlorococcus sp. MIT 1011 TaxID=3082520 RepID=UPI0039B4B6E1